jgi:hypothetical protein
MDEWDDVGDGMMQLAQAATGKKNSTPTKKKAISISFQLWPDFLGMREFIKHRCRG